MPTSESKINLETDGDDFVLRKIMPDGTTAAMKLSEADLLTLAQSSLSLREQVLSRRNPKGAEHSLVAAAEVVQIGLNQDSLGEAILLTLISPSGSQTTFAIPPLIANLLVERLPVHLAKMAETKPTKQ
jgi:hypothetical protein